MLKVIPVCADTNSMNSNTTIGEVMQNIIVNGQYAPTHDELLFADWVSTQVDLEFGTDSEAEQADIDGNEILFHVTDADGPLATAIYDHAECVLVIERV